MLLKNNLYTITSKGYCYIAIILLGLNFLGVKAKGDGDIVTTLDGPFTPVTVPLDESFRGHAVDLTEDDPRVKRNVKGFEPEQIMVSLSSGYESVWVSWVTGIIKFLAFFI